MEYVIYTASIPSAFTGADITIFAASFAYISDVSSVKNRTLRVTILDICYLITFPIGIALGIYLTQNYDLFIFYSFSNYPHNWILRMMFFLRNLISLSLSIPLSLLRFVSLPRFISLHVCVPQSLHKNVCHKCLPVSHVDRLLAAKPQMANIRSARNAQ